MVRFSAGRGFLLAAALIRLAFVTEPAAAAEKVKVAVVSSLGSVPIYKAPATMGGGRGSAAAKK